MTHDFRSLADKVCAQIRSEQNCWIGDFLKFSESIESALKQVYEQRPKVEISDEDFNSIYMKWALDRDAKKLPIGDVYFNFRQGFLAALNYIRHSVDRSECQE